MSRVIYLVLCMVSLEAFAQSYFVSVAGNDGASGIRVTEAFKTITRAVEEANAGDTIYVMPGVYKENIETVRDGYENAPIVIQGLRSSSGYAVYGSTNTNILPKAVIKPPQSDNGRLVQVRHNHIHIKDVVIDGLDGDSNVAESYSDKLLYVHNGERLEGLTGIHISRVTLRNAGGECVRFRFNVSYSSIKDSSISNCGVHDFQFDKGGKNGEGVYVGTSINQWDDGKNPTSDPDVSNNNVFARNVINTQANECIEMKEGAHSNRIIDNTCMGQLDGNSGGFSSRGNDNYFYGNRVITPAGSGFYFASKSQHYGKNNVAKENEIFGAGRYGIDDRGDEANLCGNVSRYDKQGASSSGVDIASPCK